MNVRFACELAMARKQETIIKFLDAKATFDRANHKLLLMMLGSIRGNRGFLNLVRTWFCNMLMQPDMQLGKTEQLHNNRAWAEPRHNASSAWVDFLL